MPDENVVPMVINIIELIFKELVRVPIKFQNQLPKGINVGVGQFLDTKIDRQN